MVDVAWLGETSTVCVDAKLRGSLLFVQSRVLARVLARLESQADKEGSSRLRALPELLGAIHEQRVSAVVLVREVGLELR